jgi:hypothetical protein
MRQSRDELRANLAAVISMLLNDGEPILEADFVGTETIAMNWSSNVRCSDVSQRRSASTSLKVKKNRIMCSRTNQCALTASTSA